MKKEQSSIPTGVERMQKAKALNTQIGGSHYKKYEIEPIDFFHHNKIPVIESGILKYVIRHQDKNKHEDLLKAVHLIAYLLEKEYGYQLVWECNDILPKDDTFSEEEAGCL